MAHKKFPVEVLTPEGEVYDGEVEMLSTRTQVGSIGILAGHQPILGMLEPAELRLHVSDNEIVRFAQAEGYVQIAEGRALVLVEEATPPNKLDVSSLRERLSTVEEELRSTEEGSEARRNAERNKRRIDVFLALAEGRTPEH